MCITNHHLSVDVLIWTNLFAYNNADWDPRSEQQKEKKGPFVGDGHYHLGE
jgi:hypothetical protein